MDLLSVSMLDLIINTTISSSNKTIVWKLRAAYYYQIPRIKEKQATANRLKYCRATKNHSIYTLTVYTVLYRIIMNLLTVVKFNIIICES